MAISNKNVAGGEIIPPRPWAIRSGSDLHCKSWLGSKDFTTVAYDKYWTTQTFGADSGFSNNYEFNKPNLLASVFASVVEKYALASFGSDKYEDIEGLPELCSLSGQFDFLFKSAKSVHCGQEMAKFFLPSRRMAWQYFEDVLEKLVVRHKKPSSHVYFGTVFPDCPYSGEHPEWSNCEPLTIIELLEMLEMNNPCAGPGYGPMWRDLTQRALIHRDDLTEDAGFTDLFGSYCVLHFDYQNANWSPAYRYIASLIRDIDGGCSISTLDNYLCISSNVPICSLKCYGNDYVREWMCKLFANELRDTKVFGNMGNYVKTVFNPFAFSAVVSMLNHFKKFQVMNAHVSMCNIMHREELVSYYVLPAWNGCKWTAQFSANRYARTFECNRKAIYRFATNNVCSLSLSTIIKRYADAYVMYDEDCKPVYCYYAADCWDLPYRKSESFWQWTTCSLCSVNPATLNACRIYPVAMLCPSDKDNNNIGLTYQSGQFPSLMNDSVFCRIERLSVYQFVKRNFGWEPSTPADQRSVYNLLQRKFDMDSQCRCNWIRDATFCMANNFLSNDSAIAEIEKCIECQGVDIDFKNGFTDDSFGFGSQALLDLELKLNRVPGPSSPVPKYERIRYDICTGQWLGKGCGACYEEALCRNPYGFLLYCSCGGASWFPKDSSECMFKNTRGEISYTFGGYFQTIEWNFKYLNEQ